MNIDIHQVNEVKIAEVISDGPVIANTEDGLDLVGNVYFQGFDKIILHEKNITSDFFDLKTGIAGEVLQKFSNYRIRLAIVGDFGDFQSKSIRDFIRESNRLGHINFVGSLSEAISQLLK
jgi:hypothetical protein